MLKRESDISDAERQLRNKEKKIDWLQQKMKDQAKESSKVPVAFRPSAGDMLDGLIG